MTPTQKQELDALRAQVLEALNDPTVGEEEAHTLLTAYYQTYSALLADYTAQERIALLLDALPDAEDERWEQLSEWEQSFLPFVRRQFARTGRLSEAHAESLESIWDKLGGGPLDKDH